MEHLNLSHLIVSFTSFLFWFVHFLSWAAQTVIKHWRARGTPGHCNVGHNSLPVSTARPWSCRISEPQGQRSPVSSDPVWALPEPIPERRHQPCQRNWDFVPTVYPCLVFWQHGLIVIVGDFWNGKREELNSSDWTCEGRAGAKHTLMGINIWIYVPHFLVGFLKGRRKASRATTASTVTTLAPCQPEFRVALSFRSLIV